MLKKIKEFFTKKRTIDSFLKYPEGKRIYREFHFLRSHMMDKEGMKIIRRLVKNKYKAYFVGGCIRDLLLQRTPKDFDIVTNATPKEIKRLFTNSRIIGKRFKIVHVYFKSKKRPEDIKIIEVSTFRKIPQHRLNPNIQEIDHSLLKRDNIYGNSKEDASRRDFTINALFFDPIKEVLIDYTGGVEDIKNRLIRVIGPPEISFKEDPVRMIRAIKFSILLDFQIEKKSSKAILKYKDEILKVNKSRLQEEFMKIFKTGSCAKTMEMMHQYGLFDVLFPNLIEHSIPLTNKTFNFKKKKISFAETLIYRRLQIADRMLVEREDLTYNIYMALIFADLVHEVFHPEKWKQKNETIDQYVKKQISPYFQHLSIAGKDQERISQIFIAQRQISSIDKDEKTISKQKLLDFKEKKYFFESFMVFKIYALALEDEELLQKALIWEIGPRIKPPEDAKIVSLYHKTPKTEFRNFEEEAI
ncbi:MAG: CCA tRNA nucleotidyltransferase [Leptospiraceae bacterium]|nr:CCA tRNA nucleotidyltransferase [Leptospiraceae bacterium]MDW7975363.1 polynucleotide adenylyltransferase PcnB [Leptospiraceae bacterium]